MKPASGKNHLAAIHIAFKALGISKEDACSLKLSVTGKASAADMTEQQRKRLLARLAEMQADQDKAKGRTPAYQPAKRPQAADQDARWGKARMLWASLAAAGHVRIDTDAALMAYVTRQTKLDHWRFLNGHQINSVIEALKRWCRRVNVPTTPPKEESAHG